MTSPACTGSVSSSVVVVMPLKPEMIRLAEFNILEESFILLKASSYNKFAMLLGSNGTLCTLKPLIHSVSTSAS